MGPKSRDERRPQGIALMSAIVVEPAGGGSALVASENVVTYQPTQLGLIDDSGASVPISRSEQLTGSNDVRHNARVNAVQSTALSSGFSEVLSLQTLVLTDLWRLSRSTIESLPAQGIAVTLPADNLPWTGWVLRDGNS